MRARLAFPLAVLIALAAPPAAPAADLSWTVPATTKHHTVAEAGALQVTFKDTRGCRDGRIQFRQYAVSKWSALRAVDRCRKGVKVSDPQIARDSGSGATFIVWSQVSPTNPNNNAIRYVRVLGRSTPKFTKPRTLVKLPKHVYTPPLFSAAARAGALWLMWQEPRKLTDAKPRFKVQQFRQSNGRAMTKNLARGYGRFRADANNGAMRIIAARLGVVAIWSLTDAGGKRHYYAADTQRISRRTSKRAVLKFRGNAGIEGRTSFTVSEDRRIYRISELASAPAAPGSPLRVKITQWSHSKHKWVNALRGTSQVTIPYDPRLTRQVITAQAARDGNIYLAYEAYADAQSCFIPDTATPCVRTVAPNPNAPAIFVLRIERTGAVAQAAVSWPAVSAAPAGSTVVEWRRPNSGLDAITTAFGGVRMLTPLGSQIIAPTGAVVRDSSVAAALTDPLSFTDPTG
jgi:hypothetical protein